MQTLHMLLKCCICTVSETTTSFQGKCGPDTRTQGFKVWLELCRQIAVSGKGMKLSASCKDFIKIWKHRWSWAVHKALLSWLCSALTLAYFHLYYRAPVSLITCIRISKKTMIRSCPPPLSSPFSYCTHHPGFENPSTRCLLLKLVLCLINTFFFFTEGC